MQSLLECGADVRVVSPCLGPSMQALRDSGAIAVALREYREGDIAGAFLIVAATNDSNLNASLSRDALASGILINVVDDPEKSNFIVPSSLKRGDITIAISTSGKSPALAKKMRLMLEKILPPELGGVAELLSEIRQEFRQKGISVGPGQWQDALDLQTLTDLLEKGNREQARDFMMGRLGQEHRTTEKRG